MALHDARPVPNHEAAGGLLGDRSREHGAVRGKRAADRQPLVVQPLRVPLLDIEVEAGQPVVLWHLAATSVTAGPSFFVRILDFGVMQNTDRDADESILRGSQRKDIDWLQSRETNMSKVSNDSEEDEKESVANSEWWRSELGQAVAAVRMVVSPWYLDELGNPTRTVQGA